RFIRHTNALFGLLTGLTNDTVGKMLEYFYRLHTGLEKPKGNWEWFTSGMRHGYTPPRRGTPISYQQSGPPTLSEVAEQNRGAKHIAQQIGWREKDPWDDPRF